MSGRKAALAAAAFLAGASGLGLEALFLSLCGLSLGYGRAGPIGLAVFVAGWALGARFAGARERRPATSVALAATAILAGSLAFPPALLAAGAGSPGELAALALAGLAIVAVALPQGMLLPWLARGWRIGPTAGIAALVAWNLAGAAAGAWIFGDLVPAAFGRLPAAWTAGCAAALAGALGAWALRAGAGGASRTTPVASHEERGRAEAVGVDGQRCDDDRADQRAGDDGRAAAAAAAAADDDDGAAADDGDGDARTDAHTGLGRSAAAVPRTASGDPGRRTLRRGDPARWRVRREGGEGPSAPFASGSANEGPLPGGSPLDPAAAAPLSPSALATSGAPGGLRANRAESVASGASAPTSRAPARRGRVQPLEFPLAGLLLLYLSGFALTCEWLALRLGVLWFGGMQPALTAILVASLLALALGAVLGPAVLRRGPLSVIALLCVAVTAPTYLLVAGRFLPAVPEGWPDLARALVLVGPALLPFGAAVPVLHRELERPSPGDLGRLLGYEAAGALVGVPLSHFVLLPQLGTKGALAVWALMGAAAFALLRTRHRRVALLAAAGALGVCALCVSPLVRIPALASPPFTNPALRVLDFDEDEHFAVAVVVDGLLGETTLMTDGFRAAGTGESYRYMRALGHLPLLLHPAPRRVAVLAFGTGTTAGSVALHADVERLEILELSRAVAEFAPYFEEVNRGVLAEGLPGALHEGDGQDRVLLRLGDGRRLLAHASAPFDVITMEPLLPSSPFAVYLYTREFYARARRALAADGLLCQWVPPHALRPEAFEAVVAAFTSSFEWSGLWVFGTQLALIGSSAAPAIDPTRIATQAGELGRDLAFLGLDHPAGLVARFVGAGSAWPPLDRALTDADPWIVHRPLPPGRQRLALLPDNLALLRARATDPPAEWMLGLEPAALAQLDALASLRRAREAFAIEQADQAEVERTSRDAIRGAESELAEARRLAPRDPEVEAFARELELARARREGLTLLAIDRTAEGGRRALDPLLRCAEIAPERADVHLYVAVALERIGELEAAKAALDRAQRSCPRLRETPAGDQARALGFPSTDELASAF